MLSQQFQKQTDWRRSNGKDEPDWQRNLPADWRAAAIAPLAFTHYRDYEIPASRTFGHDEDGATCYYRHVYILSSLDSDDDGEFYETIAYGEEVEAWRLRDERWLVWRIAHNYGDYPGNRGFFHFPEKMPT